jgi:hypothetical protein
MIYVEPCYLRYNINSYSVSGCAFPVPPWEGIASPLVASSLDTVKIQVSHRKATGRPYDNTKCITLNNIGSGKYL